MSKQNFTVSILVDKTPEEAFKAINNVRGWWTENAMGNSEKEGDVFSVKFGDVHYSKQQLQEVVANKKIVWLVTESELDFIEDKSEWTGSQIVFEIERKGDKTEVKFTHVGLEPDVECFSACSNAWSDYIHCSLKKLIETGKGEPTRKESSPA